jgi:hypothetical protein
MLLGREISAVAGRWILMLLGWLITLLLVSFHRMNSQL